MVFDSEDFEFEIESDPKLFECGNTQKKKDSRILDHMELEKVFNRSDFHSKVDRSKILSSSGKSFDESHVGMESKVMKSREKMIPSFFIHDVERTSRV